VLYPFRIIPSDRTNEIAHFSSVVPPKAKEYIFSKFKEIAYIRQYFLFLYEAENVKEIAQYPSKYLIGTDCIQE